MAVFLIKKKKFIGKALTYSYRGGVLWVYIADIVSLDLLPYIEQMKAVGLYSNIHTKWKEW